MELTHEFSVKVPIDEAWAVLTDLERVAPCMPGFELRGVDGGEYRGVVKVKVGPMVARYEGVATVQGRDEASYRAVVRAEGREARGQGNAAATVTATLTPEEGGTHVTLHTDLKITGKAAQFGRGVLAEVSTRLLGEFVQALEADVLAAAASEEGGATEPADEAIETRASGEAIDLLATAGSPVLKRVVPLVIAVALALWLLLRR